jgi:PAS domain S-box-containing protein
VSASSEHDAVRDRQLALLVDAIIDYAIFMLDPGGHVRTWNRGAARLKGYAAEEIVGQHLSVFYTEEDRERRHPEHELRVALRDGRFEEEGWRVRKDGSRFWANVVITDVRDPAGNHIGFGKVTRDLTRRRLGEDRLRTDASELLEANVQLDQFRRLVSSVRDYAIFMLDPGGRVATWNLGAEALKGYTTDEIIGRYFSIFFTAPDRERGHPAEELRIAGAEGRFAEEGWRVRKDGSTFWASVTITAVRDDEGGLIGFAKVTRDLTERREAEEALREANARLTGANEELDRFASIAAHDLSDPLRTMAGFAELLEGEPLSADGAGHLSHIRSTAERMQHLLDSLLAYARAAEVAQPSEPVALRGAAEHVLANLARAIADRRAQVSLDVPDGAVVLGAAPGVETVLQNLVSNALKFGRRDQPRVEITAAAQGGAWRLTVTDNGPGIADRDRDRIFGAFERAHPEAEGSGLGLAICARLVTRYGGSLGVEPAAGQGSSFWVLLPSATPIE